MKLTYSLFLFLLFISFSPLNADNHYLIASVEYVVENPPVEKVKNKHKTKKHDRKKRKASKKRKKVKLKTMNKSTTTNKFKEGWLIMWVLGQLVMVLGIIIAITSIGGGFLSELAILSGIIIAIVGFIHFIIGLVLFIKGFNSFTINEEKESSYSPRIITQKEKEKRLELEKEGIKYELTENNLEEFVDLNLKLKQKQNELRKLYIEKKKVSFPSRKIKQRILILEEEIKMITNRIEKLKANKS